MCLELHTYSSLSSSIYLFQVNIVRPLGAIIFSIEAFCYKAVMQVNCNCNSNAFRMSATMLTRTTQKRRGSQRHFSNAGPSEKWHIREGRAMGFAAVAAQGLLILQGGHKAPVQYPWASEQESHSSALSAFGAPGGQTGHRRGRWHQEIWRLWLVSIFP